MSYLFGQDFTYNFVPVDPENGQTVNPVAQTPAIYVFDEKPSRTVAAAGTGAIQSITSWDEATAGIRPITVDAIDDPDPTSDSITEQYWIAINYIISSGEQTQTILKRLKMARATSQESLIGADAEDIKDVAPAISEYYSDGELNDFVTFATDDLKDELGAAQVEFARVRNPDRLLRVVVYKALVYAYTEQIQTQNDKHDRKRDLYQGRFERALAAVRLDYDSENTGDATEETTPSTTEWSIER